MLANAAVAAAIAPPPPPPQAAAPFPPLPSENPDEEGALGLPPLPAPPPIIPEAPTRLEQTKVPLAWTAAKVGPAVNISGDGATASRSASGCGAQLTSEWMQGGRHPHVYHLVLALDEVMPETMIGIVGKNYWPSDWSEPLAKSLHSIVLECGSGKFFVKGKATSFMLKPLMSGARLHMMLDMQVQEMTLELLGTSPGQILSSVTIEAIPAEVTLVAGFCAGGPQSVRVVACTKELPEMKLLGKLKKDLWDEDNKVEPLALNVKKVEPTLLQAQQNEAKVAQSLDMSRLQPSVQNRLSAVWFILSARSGDLSRRC